MAATWRHSQQIETMERNLGKYPFEVGMRGWIVSSKEVTSNYYNLIATRASTANFSGTDFFGRLSAGNCATA